MIVLLFQLKILRCFIRLKKMKNIYHEVVVLCFGHVICGFLFDKKVCIVGLLLFLPKVGSLVTLC